MMNPIPAPRWARSRHAATKRSGARRSVMALGILMILSAAIVLPATVQGSLVRQLTDTKAAYPRTGALDAAGSMVITNSPTNQLGGNPLYRWQIFKFDAVTGAGQQLTNFRLGVSDGVSVVSVSDDGTRIAFVSSSDPVGQNHDASPEIFVMMTNGSGLIQITNDPAPNAGSVSALSMSGTANRIAYISNSDPLGLNPSHVDQVFVVNIDGTGRRQLTAATTLTSMSYFLTISDDGQKVAFSSKANLTGGNLDLGFEVFVVLADGTGLRQLTSSASATQASQNASVSGDGAKVTFESKGDLVSGGNTDHFYEVFVINWDGTGLRQLTNVQGRDSRYPSITDNGSLVAFVSSQTVAGNFDGNDEVMKIAADGTGLTVLTNSSFYPNGAYGPITISGSGNRCAFPYSGNLPPTALNPDAGPELYVKDASGGAARQLTITTQFYNYNPAITDDGSKIIYLSDTDPFGTNPAHSDEIFRINADGTGLVELTSSARAYAPTISPDGSIVAFASTADVTGSNPEGNSELFAMASDGTGIHQLTIAPSGGVLYSSIAANNSVIVFFSTGNYTGQNADLTSEIYSIKPDGTNLRQLTLGDRNSYYPRVDASGVWVVFSSLANLTGSNPDHSSEVYRVRSDGTGLQQITSDPIWTSASVDVSGAGDLIAYTSTGDPFGTNPEHNPDLFIWKASTGTSQQVTFTSSGVMNRCSVSRNGAYVYFYSTAEFVEDDDDYSYDLYRYVVATGAIERVGARHGAVVIAKPQGFQVYPPAVDATGTRVAFSIEGDMTGENGDHLEQVWLIDRAAPSQIQVSKASPTLVSWQHESGPIRYSVIRGSVSSMGPGTGGTVSLGPVVCLDKDSPVNDTFGYEDPVQPAPGVAFFYSHRGSEGLDVGPGSYGVGSSGGERMPASGDCAP